MRSFLVASLAVVILVFGANANARGWRDLRIDASTDTRFNESVQQMRDELPYERALIFVLTLRDLKARLSPVEYREHLNGLTYNEIARLGSPNVAAEYRTYSAKLRHGDPTGGLGESGSGLSYHP